MTSPPVAFVIQGRKRRILAYTPGYPGLSQLPSSWLPPDTIFHSTYRPGVHHYHPDRSQFHPPPHLHTAWSRRSNYESYQHSDRVNREAHQPDEDKSGWLHLGTIFLTLLSNTFYSGHQLAREVQGLECRQAQLLFQVWQVLRA